MSLIDLASMVLAPTAVKDGKVYNAIPNDQDFTFSRGTEATRVNSAGLIEKARTNFLLQSNAFDTTWGQINSSVTINAITAPDGSLTASKIVEDTSNSQHRLDQATTSSSGVNTFSVYLKQGERTTAWLRIGLNRCYVDLTDGSISNVASNIIASSTELANDWYRVSITKTNASANETVRINIQTGDYTGDGTSGIYLWSSQYEQGLVTTDYIETTTSSVTVGITDDLPRVDYSGGGCPSLLLEPSRTNLAVHSEYFEASNWTALRSSIAISSIISPEGKVNAYKLTTDSTSNNTHIIYYSGTFSTDTYALSIYAKAAEFSKVGIGTGNLTLSAKFDLSNGSVITSGAHTASIEDAGNGWYRCFIVTNTTTPIRIVLLDDDGNISFDGDGTSGLYIYGHQAEAGNYVSSYIPTYGTSTSRSADSCSLTGASNLIGQSEGTIYIEFDNNQLSTYPNEYIYQIVDGSTELWIRKESGGSGFTARLIVSGSTIWTIGIIPPDGLTKIATAYKSGDSVIYMNGTIVGSVNTSTYSGSSFDTLNFFRSTLKPELLLKQAILFPTRLTNDQLQELTK